MRNKKGRQDHVFGWPLHIFEQEYRVKRAGMAILPRYGIVYDFKQPDGRLTSVFGGLRHLFVR